MHDVVKSQYLRPAGRCECLDALIYSFVPTLGQCDIHTPHMPGMIQQLDLMQTRIKQCLVLVMLSNVSTWHLVRLVTFTVECSSPYSSTPLHVISSCVYFGDHKLMAGQHVDQIMSKYDGVTVLAVQ